MHKIYQLLVLAIFSGVIVATPFAITAAAESPAASATTTTKSCNTIATLTAKFDKLPTFKPPPTNFASINYVGFDVVDALDYASFNAKSPNNVIRAGAGGAYLSQGSRPGSTIVFGLGSFYFACASYGGSSFGPFASECELEVITTAPTPQIEIQKYGPFTYTVTYDGQGPNMTKVDLNGGGGQIFFNLVSGPGTSMLFLDNLVLYQHKDCPS